MIREEKFVFSHRPYAVDLASFTTVQDRPGNGYSQGRVDAVWFRRKNGVTAAHIGFLWDTQYDATDDVRDFLDRHTDGRYGGQCTGRWDGTSYWGNGPLTEQDRHLAVLRPMLEAYPALPEGYDGWWKF